MRIASAVLLLSSLRFVTPAWAIIATGIYDGSTNAAVSLERAVRGVHPGEVVIVSEQHDRRQHHANQLAALQVLKMLGLKISVGLEFLHYPDQRVLERFVQGQIQESDFLRAIHWSGYPFDWYRPLILFPRESGGQARALNAPVGLTEALAHKGLAGLSDAERSWLPPDCQFGNGPYFERFAADVRQHGALTEEAVRNFFAAQSAWDDTMAWQGREYLNAYPDQVLVIIVGDFHAAYGGGLPDRLRARGVRVLVISQVDTGGLTDEEVRPLLAPDPRYGARADYVWLSQE